MAGSNNKPAKRESQPPKKGAGSPDFSVRRGEQVAFDQLTQRTVMQSMSVPLPHSVEFARYDETLPGAANRILAMAEKEQQARLEENKERLRLDEKVIKGYKWRSGFAQFAALALVLVAFYVSHDLAMNGHDAAGISLGSGTIAAILAAFLGAKITQAKADKDNED
jgi:uncharacterized membrane protein